LHTPQDKLREMKKATGINTKGLKFNLQKVNSICFWNVENNKIISFVSENQIFAKK
jgi:hypothetical protein